jgi:translation initiation factor 2 subunit 3
LVNDIQLKKNYDEIKKFIKGSIAENAPIIPLSGQSGANVDALLNAIEEYIPSPKIKKEDIPIMLVARSFDVNKPGKEVADLLGTILGGALKQGILKKGDDVAILPGVKVKDKWEPLSAKIESINYSGTFVEQAIPGGSFGLSTSLDPYFGKNDKLSGSVVCLKDKQINVYSNLELKFKMLDNSALKINEILLLNNWTAKTTGVVKNIKKDVVSLALALPIASMKNERIPISRKIGNRWKLSGWGEIQ